MPAPQLLFTLEGSTSSSTRAAGSIYWGTCGKCLASKKLLFRTPFSEAGVWRLSTHRHPAVLWQEPRVFRLFASYAHAVYIIVHPYARSWFWSTSWIPACNIIPHELFNFSLWSLTDILTHPCIDSLSFPRFQCPFCSSISPARDGPVRWDGCAKLLCLGWTQWSTGNRVRTFSNRINSV